MPKEYRSDIAGLRYPCFTGMSIQVDTNVSPGSAVFSRYNLNLFAAILVFWCRQSSSTHSVSDFCRHCQHRATSPSDLPSPSFWFTRCCIRRLFPRLSGRLLIHLYFNVCIRRQRDAITGAVTIRHVGRSAMNKIPYKHHTVSVCAMLPFLQRGAVSRLQRCSRCPAAWRESTGAEVMPVAGRASVQEPGFVAATKAKLIECPASTASESPRRCFFEDGRGDRECHQRLR